MADKVNANIANLRELRGWSRRQLIEKLEDNSFEIGETALRRIESGQREVRLAEAQGFAKVFEVTLDSLANDEVNKDQAVLADALSQVGKDQYAIILGICHLVGNLRYLERHLERLRKNTNESLQPLLDQAEEVLENSTQYLDLLQEPYRVMLSLGQDSSPHSSNFYSQMKSEFEEIRNSADFIYYTDTSNFDEDEDDSGSR